MHFQNTTRRASVAILLLALSMMAAGCDAARTTDPQPSAIATPSHRASLDDDPATCKSGYTLVDGHVVCN